MELSDSDDSLTESIFASKTRVDGFNLVDWASTLSLFLEIFAPLTISLCACLVKAPVHLPIGRIIRPALEMEDKSVLQLLFWNRFHGIKIAETKLEHKEETFLNFCKEFFLDVLQFISTAVTLLQGNFKA